MAIPDYETLMLPLLKIAADNQEHRIGEVILRLADEFGLTEQERQQLLPSGKQATFSNRAHWARGVPRSGWAPGGHKAGTFQDHRTWSERAGRRSTAIGR